MAVKTITIDMEAYDLLSSHKEEGQSFSRVIKAHFGPQPTVARFRRLVGASRLDPRTLDTMDQQVRARKKHPARVASL